MTTADPSTLAGRLALSYRRVSDPGQVGGAGLDRQAGLFLEFCQRHRLTPNPDPLVDKGLSAYHGRHRVKGALGVFISAARDGRIPPGAVLVVEDLDRFSREAASYAEELLLELFKLDLALGIVRDDMVVDRALYDKDLGVRVRLLTRRDAAHDFSRKLSGRISDVWARRQADWVQHGKRFLSVSFRPFWLSDDGKDFVVIPEKADLVRLMFKLSAEDCMGSTQIADRLNRDGHKPERVAKWSSVRVNRILEDRRVIGEKEWPDKTISEGYFPPIITTAEFDASMAALRGRDSRRGKHGRGVKIANLFQGAVYCVCGRPMSYRPGHMRDGVPTKEFLRCTGRRDKICPQPPGDYLYDEQALLLAFIDQRWDKFFGRSSDNTERRELQKRIRTLEATHAQQNDKAANALRQAEKAIESGVLTPEAANLFAKLQADATGAAAKTVADLNTARAELQALSVKPSGKEMQAEIRARAKQFLKAGRHDIEQRRAFNNWLLGLGFRITITDAKLGRIQWDRTDAVLYRTRDGGLVQDETLEDLRLFGAPEDVIAARRERIELERRSST